MALRRTVISRLVLLLGCSAVWALVIPGMCVAAPSAPPAQDSVSGHVVAFVDAFNPPIVWDVAVTSGPSGENPTGSVLARVAGPPPIGFDAFRGDAICLHVEGNVALVVINDTLHPTPVALRFTDNGAADFIETGEAHTTSCSTPEAAYSLPEVVMDGDLVVVDAQPGPTSKDQCKNGGFTSFGFKNQGQCVAFVQRGSSPKPE